MRSSEPVELRLRVAVTLGQSGRDRGLFDAETLIGFYRYFDFPASEVFGVFPSYGLEVLMSAWSIIEGYFGEGGAGVTANLKPPPRWRERGRSQQP